MNRVLVTLSYALVLGIAPSVFADAAPDYRKDVVPILRTYCVGCHNGTEANGQLELQTFAKLTKGGEKGPEIVAGKSAESRLFLMVTGKTEPKMPPEENPAPSAAEIETLRAWIDAGAHGPEDTNEAIVLDPVVPAIASKSPHANRIYSAAWSPDGKWIALGGNKRVVLLDAATGYIERVLEGHAGKVADVSFSADGMLLLSASGVPGVRGESILWRVGDGTRVRVFSGQTDALYAARLSPDQKILATACYDKTILLWNVDDGKVLHELNGHNEAVYDLAFRPDAKTLASVSGDRTFKLWNVETGARLDTLSESLKELATVLFTPDGTRVLAGGVDNRIRVWNISPSAAEGTNKLTESRFGHEGAILKLALNKAGDLLASAATDHTVKLWKLPAVEEIRVLEKQSDWPSAILFSPDAKQLLVTRQNGTASVYDVANGAKIKDLIATEKPPAPPTLVRRLPAGVMKGSPGRVEIDGTNLAKTTEIKSSHAGLTANVIREPAPLDNKIIVELSASADVPRSRQEIRIVTPGGQTEPLAVFVDELSSVVESEPNNVPAAANAITLPAVAWGTLSAAGDEDRYTFDAHAGETLVFDASTADLGSPANLVLTLSDSTGRTIASTNDTNGQADPFLHWTAPADGKYTVNLHDLAFAGSDKHTYRLTLGALPYVIGVHPLTIPLGKDVDIELVGPNIAAATKVHAHADKGGEYTVPIDPALYRFRRPFSIAAVGTSLVEVEPNNEAKEATLISLPGEAGGTIGAAGDADLYRFNAKKGAEWIFEIDAARRGSPIDARLDVLSTDGAPIERVWLAAVRDSYIEFRNIDASQTEIRCKNWEEMELNELMYMNGEVSKLFRHPRGPDSGFQFYPVAGSRRSYFDTSSTTHALEDPVYIVRPVTPGTMLVSNGLPVFKLTYANDDATDRRLGSDSRLVFTAPADGDYVIRVIDVRNSGGPRFAYRLIARQPQPDFRVRLNNRTPSVHRGSGREISFSAERVDGFEGAIEITAQNIPAGLSIPSPISIEPGHESTSTVLTAAPDTPVPTAEQWNAMKLDATAQINGATVTHPIEGITSINLADKPGITVRVEPAEITLAPGKTVSAKLIIERHGHNDRVTFEMPGLPHGVIVDNIGLNGILIHPGETEREFFLTARPFVPNTDRPFFARANEVDGQASPPIIMHIRNPEELAQRPSP